MVTDDQIRDVVEAVIKEADYDLWQSFFVEDFIEDSEEAQEAVARMVEVARKAMINTRGEQ